MHVWRNDEKPKYAVHSRVDADVPVIEHGRGVQKNLENQYGCRGRAKESHDSQLDQQGEEDFYGVKAKACGHIVIEVCMMHPVNTPEDSEGVKHDVLKIDRQIHQHQRYPKGQPIREVEMIQ